MADTKAHYGNADRHSGGQQDLGYLILVGEVERHVGPARNTRRQNAAHLHPGGLTVKGGQSSAYVPRSGENLAFGRIDIPFQARTNAMMIARLFRKSNICWTLTRVFTMLSDTATWIQIRVVN